jgi:hypothetical protein
MIGWMIIPPKLSGYYHAIPVHRDSRLDGNPIEVVYLYFDGRWSVCRPGMNKHAALAEFSHWSGPIPFPDLPPEVADADDS